MAHHATAAEVKVLASPASREACSELIPGFEGAAGYKVVVTWSGTQNIRKQIAAGELYDIVIVARPELDEFVMQGAIMPESRADLMKSAIGAAVRAGAQKPDISSGEALKKTLLAARSIGYSSGPSGTHMAELIERMGIANQIKAKVKQTPSGLRVASAIAAGEVEIGFQQVSELIAEAGIDYIGPLPAEVQKITVFTAGIHSRAREPQAARELVKYFTTPASIPILRKYGLEPA
jgi:molybdate transport system substrate-binding protein